MVYFTLLTHDQYIRPNMLDLPKASSNSFFRKQQAITFRNILRVFYEAVTQIKLIYACYSKYISLGCKVG